MPAAPQLSDDRAGGPPAGVSVSRALGSSTRADIYERLRREGTALTVRDVAAAFDLHPNVARTHLETLAEAGLVSVGRRKHPGGGRPAKLYVARSEGTSDAGPAQPPRWQDAGLALLVRLLAGLLTDGEAPASGAALTRRAHEAAVAEGRRLAAAAPSRSPSADGDAGVLEVAAERAIRGLRPFAPAARVARSGREWVDIVGVRGLFATLGDGRAGLAEALERGLLSGALEASGVSVTLSDAGTVPAAGAAWRARSTPPTRRAATGPSGTVDARGQQREAGVVQAMRAVTGMRPGEVLEVLAEGPGSPAAFARWADRAGHELLGVERATDATGRPAIRLLIRKGAS